MTTAVLDDPRSHWESVYIQKGDQQTSWFQEEPTLSLRLIEEVAADRASHILDAGAGRSRLAECLVDRGYDRITVVDLSAAALEEMREQMGSKAASVRFIAGDLLELGTIDPVDVWHDRAVFHFLTEPEQRNRYLGVVQRSLRPGGHLILATFAPDGPEACSGLPVSRYDAEALADAVGAGFVLRQAMREIHTTPWGAKQPFTYAVFELC